MKNKISIVITPFNHKLQETNEIELLENLLKEIKEGNLTQPQ